MMPLMYEADEAKDERPLGRDGADCRTCWTCANGERVADAGRDASVCYVHRFVERYPHESNECDEWAPR